MILRYTIAWFAMMVLAIINGAFREYFYKSKLGDPAANQVSTVILLILVTAYIWLLIKRWPFRSAAQAWLIGIIWFIMTELFEFGMGISAGDSWEKMIGAYNVFAGQLWIFIPLWILISPYLFYRLFRKGGAEP
jgi:hypothetical protein